MITNLGDGARPPSSPIFDRARAERPGLGDAPHRLLDDERGAIMVMGIFMCTCLVGALWYIATIGDAILYRERLQEAADAIAFSDAALRARGMNLIVLLNLIMACVLGIRVALRVTQVVLGIAAAVFAVLGIFVGVFLSAVGPCIEAIQQVQSALDTVNPHIDNTLKSLTKTQTVIAKVTPTAASAAAVGMVGAKYVSGRNLASTALGAAMDAEGELPVERGEVDKLCVEAGRSTVGIFQWLLNEMGLHEFGKATEWLGKQMGTIASISPQFFCGMGSPVSGPALDGIFAEAAEERCSNGGPAATYHKSDDEWLSACEGAGVVCSSDPSTVGVTPLAPRQGRQLGTTTAEKQKELDELRSKRDAAANSYAGYINKFGFTDVSHGACLEWAKEDARMAFEEQQREFGQQAQTTETQEMTGKKVKSDWFNGTSDAQLVRIAAGDSSTIRRSSRFVRIAAVEDRRANRLEVPTAASIPSWAQAEFFFDCAGAWKRCNEDDDAMWHLQWRARLRRNSGARPVSNVLGSVGLLTNLKTGIEEASALVDKSALDRPLNTLYGNTLLKKELVQALADKNVVLHGIH